MRNAFLKALTETVEVDSDVMLLTADLGFGVFENLQKNHPKSYLNVGVCEQNMTGMATGLALEGKTVLTYSIGNFPTLRCLEQIRNDACYHKVNVKIVCTGAGFSYGALGMSHHATEDLSVMRALPGLTLLAPASSYEAYHATKAMIDAPGVFYLRIDKTEFEESDQPEEYSVGKARCIRDGSDLAIIATGGIIKEALLAADQLEKEGVRLRVLSMHTLKPIDDAAIISAVEETAGILTLEENNWLGGLGGAVSEVCMKSGKYPKSFKMMGLKDRYSSIVGSQQYLRSQYGLDAAAIVNNIKEMLA